MITVEFREYFSGYTIHVISLKWHNRFKRRVIDNGGTCHERTVLALSCDDIGEYLSKSEIDQVHRGWPVRKRMDPWIVGHLYGYDAHTVTVH